MLCYKIIYIEFIWITLKQNWKWLKVNYELFISKQTFDFYYQELVVQLKIDLKYLIDACKYEPKVFFPTKLDNYIYLSLHIV